MIGIGSTKHRAQHVSRDTGQEAVGIIQVRADGSLCLGGNSAGTNEPIISECNFMKNVFADRLDVNFEEGRFLPVHLD